MAYNSRGQWEASDQSSLTFVESQAAKIESQIHEEELVGIQWPQLIQVYSDMDVADDVLVSYISRPGTGRMTPLANGATDIPRTDIEYDRITREAYASGLAYGWDDMEVERAIKLGRPLQADKVRASFRVADEEKERTVLFGNDSYGWPGLISNYSTTESEQPRYLRVDSGDQWDLADTTKPFATIRRAFDMIFADSDKIEVPDTLLVPNRAGSYLFEMIKTDGGLSTMSIWDFIMQSNPYTKMTGRPLKIMMVNELDEAGSTTNAINGAKGTGNTAVPRMVLYNSSLKCLRFIMPQDLNFLPGQRVAWTTTFYGRMKLGGVQYLRPKSMVVIDNFASNLKAL